MSSRPASGRRQRRSCGSIFEEKEREYPPRIETSAPGSAQEALDIELKSPSANARRWPAPTAAREGGERARMPLPFETATRAVAPLGRPRTTSIARKGGFFASGLRLQAIRFVFKLCTTLAPAFYCHCADPGRYRRPAGATNGESICLDARLDLQSGLVALSGSRKLMDLEPVALRAGNSAALTEPCY